MLAPPPVKFLTAQQLEPASQPDFTAASRKRFGGAAEGSSSLTLIIVEPLKLSEKAPILCRSQGLYS